MSWEGTGPLQAVQSSMVSPERTMTAPLACLAILPVSKVMSRPPTEIVIELCCIESPKFIVTIHGEEYNKIMEWIKRKIARELPRWRIIFFPLENGLFAKV